MLSYIIYNQRLWKGTKEKKKQYDSFLFAQNYLSEQKPNKNGLTFYWKRL